MIDRVQGFYGFTRIPFGRNLAPSMLHQHHSHREAAARIAWCNYDMDSTTPFAVVLIGQPTLRKRMKHGVLAALDQRIAISYQMPTMSREETSSYIKHHITIASRQDTLFSDDTVELIHLTSRGLPRSVNNIAWQALIAAFTQDKGIVDESSARLAITETHTSE
ncbi:type II secretory pathway predicted ATPase ExeA [Streptacidiphilus sp. MAP12-33]|uniref:hypothetical protein n=1 Tax=Streptacidiphilus sp. MAP12-33 TaxID=3156266 RepID=UPI003512C819